ncbi:MAG: phosphate acyltransferase PlsX [bacterium]
MRIALDAMTSELGVEEAVYGLFNALALVPDLKVLAVGRPDVLRPLLDKGPRGLLARVELIQSSDVIGMDEEPSAAFKAKRDASVSVAARLVKEGRADGALSPGNSGASMAAATLLLGRVPGVRRPAILTLLPSRHGYCGLLDSGAVVDCRPEDLAQFAVMGSVFMQHVMGVAAPRVGLLSIGEEDKKGNAQTLEALPLLKAAGLNFLGNVEGRDLFDGSCDLAVCDGFVGNIVLKTAEGLAKLITSELRAQYSGLGPLAKLGGLLSRPAFRALSRRMSPDTAGGGPLLGVGGVFIITHGKANRTMLMNGLKVAATCAAEDVPARLGAAFATAERAA